MSDVINLEDAKMARSLGLAVGSMMVAEVSESDVWKTAPLHVVYGLTRAIAQLGLEGPRDHPCELRPEDPMFATWSACAMLAGALGALRLEASGLIESGQIGSDHVSALLTATANQLEALMRGFHEAAYQTHRLTKAEEESYAAREALRRSL